MSAEGPATRTDFESFVPPGTGSQLATDPSLADQYINKFGPPQTQPSLADQYINKFGPHRLTQQEAKRLFWSGARRFCGRTDTPNRRNV